MIVNSIIVFYDKSTNETYDRDDPPVYFCNGLYGAFWGIIAGPIGIRMSKSNNLSQTKCLWRAYIPLIFITVMGSTAGFILSVFNARFNSSEYYGGRFKLYRFYTAMSFIEIIVIFGKTSCFYYSILKHFQFF